MSKILRLILLFILIYGCSLDKKSKIWSIKEKKDNNDNKELIVEELFKDEKRFSEEINLNVRINLVSKLINGSSVNNFTNNDNRTNYDGNLKTVSKYKFSKIDNFNRFEPVVIFDNKNLFFFDNKGSILKYDQNSKLIWKKNYYKRSEKKLRPLLSMAIYKNYLIVVDNLAKYYAIDSETGKLIWMKNNSAPFNSQIKIYENRIFVTDFKNVLKCFSINDGKELWSLKTDNSFVKSQKKLSIILTKNIVFFNNTLGDISAVDLYKGKLIWQTPTQDSSIFESSFQLKTSDLIISDKRILFSNNKNEFYSLDIKTGTLIWKKKISSSVKPIAMENLVFTISENGFFIILDANTGDIIRITDIFDSIKEKKRSKVKPVGFVFGKKNVYLTTSNGHLIVINIVTGKSNLIKKIDNEKISSPFIKYKNLFIVKNNAILRLN